MEIQPKTSCKRLHDLTLTKAISKCQAQEATKKQHAYLHNFSQKQHFVKCPAYNQTSFNQKIGHFAKVCWSRTPRQQGASTATGTTPHAKLSNIHHPNSPLWEGMKELICSLRWTSMYLFPRC